MDLYILQAMPVGTYRVQSPGFPKIVYCCFNCRAGQSHKDNVRCTAVEEQPEAKEVQLTQPSSTSLLLISPGTRWFLVVDRFYMVLFSALEQTHCDRM